MIPQTDLDHIRESFPRILEHYGINPNRDFRIPWRDDSKPSGHYSSESNLVTDFGSDERYNVYQFVGMVEGLTDFKDQAQRAADIVGLQLGNERSSTPTSSMPKATRPRFELPAKAGFDEDMPMLEFAWLMGYGALESDIAKSYLHGRGFCNHDIYQNMLGYVPSKKILLDDDGTMLFPTFEPSATRGYIVLPFPSDETFCRVCYFMLRTIPGDELPQHKELRPKGITSPLYREHLLSSGCDALYITEGILDAIALETLLNKPVVGLGGTNFTKRLSSVLYATPKAQRPNKIVLALDADAPGRKAASKIAADLDALGIPHANFDMPSGCKDPCDVLLQLVDGGRNG